MMKHFCIREGKEEVAFAMSSLSPVVAGRE